MGGSLRTTGVLAAKFLADAVKTPGIFFTCLTPILFTLLFFMVLPAGSEGVRGHYKELHSYTLASSQLFVVTVVPAMVALYALTLEKEKQTLRTLLFAGVSMGQVLVGRGAASVLTCVIVGAACLVVLGVPASELSALLVLIAVGSLPLTLASLAAGLFARDQMGASLYSTPIMLLGLAPMFFMYNADTARAIPFLPSGGAFRLAVLANEGALFTPDAILPAISIVAWTVALTLALIALNRRLANHDKGSGTLS